VDVAPQLSTPKVVVVVAAVGSVAAEAIIKPVQVACKMAAAAAVVDTAMPRAHYSLLQLLADRESGNHYLVEDPVINTSLLLQLVVLAISEHSQVLLVAMEWLWCSGPCLLLRDLTQQVVEQPCPSR
jgi:hypothetical protein